MKRWKFDALAERLDDVQHMPKPYARFCHNLIRKFKLKTVLEFGCFKGKSAAYFGNAVGPKGSVITLEMKSLDTDAEDLHAALGLDNIQVVRHPGGGEWVCKYFIERQMDFDMVYIDGGHDFKHVLADYYLAKKLVRPGGWIVFDDIVWTHEKLFQRRPEIQAKFRNNFGEDQVRAQHVKLVWDHIVTQDHEIANIVYHNKWFAAVQKGMPAKQRATLSLVRHPVAPVKHLPMIFSIVDRSDLLPHFVDHYVGQGVTKFHCCLYRLADQSAVESVFRDKGADFAIHKIDREYLPLVDYSEHNTIRRNHATGWYVVADVDEFHQVGHRTLAEAATMAAAEGSDVVMGRFIDRITRDGSIPPSIDADKSIGRQFPYTAWMTSMVSKGCDSKVLMAKAAVPVTVGHHTLPDGDWKVWRIKGQAHHYKWWGNLIARSRDRFVKYEEKGLPHAPESRRLAEYLEEHNGIDVSNLLVYPFINTWV